MNIEDVLPQSIKRKRIKDGDIGAFLFQIETYRGNIQFIKQNKGVETRGW